MDVARLLDDKATKPIEKRKKIAESIIMKILTIQEIQSLKNAFDDKKMTLILEAMEAVTVKNPEIADLDWLKFTQDFITSESNNIKREASRIVGNIAHLFPNDLAVAIDKLLVNTKNDGTVIRWGSAYALGRIIIIHQYANSELFDVITGLFENEKENGVKNQYLNGLKKAKKIRK